MLPQTQSGGVHVTALPRMFRDERVTGILPPGWTVDEIIGQLVTEHAIHPMIIPALHVAIIDDERGTESAVPFDRWKFVRPKAGCKVVVRAVPMGGGGGGGGGKSPVKMIAMIAIMVVAAVATAGAGAAIMGSATAMEAATFGGMTLTTIGAGGAIGLTTAGMVVAGAAGMAVPMTGPAFINARIHT